MAFFGIGHTLATALETAERLAIEGLQAAVYSVPTLQPLDRVTVLDIARRSRLLISIEEHGAGGLGTILAEILAGSGLPARLVRKFLDKPELMPAGSREYLLERQGLDAEGIFRTAVSLGANENTTN